MAGSAGKQASFDGASGHGVEDLEALGHDREVLPVRELGSEIQDLEAPEAGAAHFYQVAPLSPGTQGAAAPARRADRNCAGTEEPEAHHSR